MAKLLYQGHGSFRITTEEKQVIYVDPFAGEGYDLPGDIILISHEHHDHNNVDLIHIKDGEKIFRSSDFIIEDGYKSIEVEGIVVKAVPAYNKNHSIENCVGYLITVDGVTIYAAGDTSKTDYMSQVLSKQNIDYALLPTDGIYNMDEKEASECAKIIGAKHSIPIHMKPGGLFDDNKANAFEADGKIILKPGMEITLIK